MDNNTNSKMQIDNSQPDPGMHEWIQRNLQNFPKWSDAKWNQVFAHMGMELAE